MTTPETEEPLVRLNYFNGQRLEAVDLRVEQDYHMRVRRLLNQALYTPGIASGLEVRPDSDNSHQVLVSPGVALDTFGREVILLEETEVPVSGLPNTDASWIYGNFLTVEYAEAPASNANDQCTTASEKYDLAWGGPTRIRTEPVLDFRDAWPDESTGPIILAQVELDAGCAVAAIHNQTRKYVDAAPSRTRSISLEGEKDIAEDNSKMLSFHVVGGPAKSVTLYLWAGEISSLLYSQLAPHKHDIPVLQTESQLGDTSEMSHTHDVDLSVVEVGEESPVHGGDHDVRFPYRGANDGDKNEHIKVGKDDSEGNLKIVSDLDGLVTGGAHKHPLVVTSRSDQKIPTGEPIGDLSSGSHHHNTIESATGATGHGTASDVIEPGTTKRMSYFDGLEVYLDGDPVSISEDILSQLGGPTNGWDRLGDGTSAHKLVSEGTGPIALERIRTINQGEHVLEFRVPNESGGSIRYNLYVE